MSRAREPQPETELVGFADVPPDIIAYCRRLGRQMSVERGAALTRQGDAARHCYYVCTGYARVRSTSPSGGEVLVGFAGPSNLIGHSAAAEWGDRYLTSTTASEPMVLISWTRTAALEIGRRFPRLHARLDALLAQCLQLVLNRLHTTSGGRGPQRLAAVLLELAKRHGQPDPDGHGIMIRPTVTREDLASLTGMSLFTASRALSGWEAHGVIASRRGRMRLIDLTRLRAIAKAS